MYEENINTRVSIEDKLLHEFLSNLIEMEEVWSTGGKEGWMLGENEKGVEFVRVWSKKQDALEFSGREDQAQQPLAVSLDHFMYSMLENIESKGILLEIAPRKGEAGKSLSGRELYQILEGMVDAGEYNMEG